MQKIKLIMSAVLLCTAMPMFAVIGTTDFTVENLAYHITSSADKTVEVGLSSSSSSSAYWGSVSEVTIPSTVTYNGTTYRVTKIANCGFTSPKLGNSRVISLTPTASCSNKESSDRIYPNDADSNEPETVTGNDGNTYTVFSHTAPDGSDWTSGTYNNYYHNPNLTKVSFADNCQITEIGFFAFEGCTALQSFQVPLSVTEIGPLAFALCTSLSKFEFLTYTDTEDNNTQKTYVKTIPYWGFIGCQSLTSLYLPEGIEVIQNRALQYCFNLATIHLPNTLKVIGSHFLCEDHAIQSITIPASVVYMSNGLFHGCCGLTDVYMLGAPATLDAGSSSSSDESFGANRKFGGDAVSNCTIWVYSDWLNQYKTGDGWKHFLEVASTNQYKPYPEETRTIPNRWVTCCLWKDYTAQEVINQFGAGTKVAYLTKAVVDKNGYDSHGAKIGNMYDLTFTVESLENASDIVIKKNTPFMLKSANNNVTVTVYDATTMRQNGEESEISKEHQVTVGADNGAYVLMGSYYPDGDYKLYQWECYFKNPEYTVTAADVADANFIAKYGNVSAGDEIYDVTKAGYMGFYRATMDNFTALKSGRCFWRVVGDPEMTGNGNAKQMVGMTYDVWEESVNGIDNLRVKMQTLPNEVYNLDGQRVNSLNMKKGIYIVNGKKTVVK